MAQNEFKILQFPKPKAHQELTLPPKTVVGINIVHLITRDSVELVTSAMDSFNKIGNGVEQVTLRLRDLTEVVGRKAQGRYINSEPFAPIAIFNPAEKRGYVCAFRTEERHSPVLLQKEVESSGLTPENMPKISEAIHQRVVLGEVDLAIITQIGDNFKLDREIPETLIKKFGWRRIGEKEDLPKAA